MFQRGFQCLLLLFQDGFQCLLLLLQDGFQFFNIAFVGDAQSFNVLLVGDAQSFNVLFAGDAQSLKVLFGGQTLLDQAGLFFGEDFGLGFGHAGAGQAFDEVVGVEGGGFRFHDGQGTGWGGCLQVTVG